MNYTNFERLLVAAYAEYLQLEQAERAGACERVLATLSSMLREQDGRKRKLTELGSTNRTSKSSAKTRRGKLVRKTNARSPQSPLKPVKVTTQNEL